MESINLMNYGITIKALKPTEYTARHSHKPHYRTIPQNIRDCSLFDFVRGERRA